MHLIYIFLGSGLGGITRYGISRLLPTSAFPMGTLTANILACLILGMITGYASGKELISENTRLFWTAGFCGGFSTFSTFSNETLSLMKTGNSGLAIFYIVASLVTCLLATYGGIMLMTK